MNFEKAILYLNFFIALSVVGLTMTVFLGNYTDAATVSLIGFSIVAIALLTSLLMPVALRMNMEPLSRINSFKFIRQLFVNNIPILLSSALVIWNIVINSVYFEQINDGKVASEYNKFWGLSIFMMILQIYIAFNYLRAHIILLHDTQNVNAIKTKKQMNSVSYLVTPLNIILLGIIHVILEFFSTDG
tara:strand:- start:2739 stop:3302 length:564 start_codon:yes stop_codon:yes gene_type:complete